MMMENEERKQRNLQLLEQVAQCYGALAEFRQRRQRAVNFYRGRQWSDVLLRLTVFLWTSVWRTCRVRMCN